MFERFTDRARRVVVLAQEEARTLNHNYIGTEHIILALVAEGEGVAAKVLVDDLGLGLEAIRERVLAIIGKGAQAPSGHIPFTPRAKKILELALREALQLGHSYIGTEHILLGLIREGEGVGAQVLCELIKAPQEENKDLLNFCRQKTIQRLSGYAEAQPEVENDPETFTAYTDRLRKRAQRFGAERGPGDKIRITVEIDGDDLRRFLKSL